MQACLPTAGQKEGGRQGEEGKDTQGETETILGETPERQERYRKQRREGDGRGGKVVSEQRWRWGKANKKRGNQRGHGERGGEAGEWEGKSESPEPQSPSPRWGWGKKGKRDGEGREQRHWEKHAERPRDVGRNAGKDSNTDGKRGPENPRQ